jgi:hypothetical protein
MITTKRIIKTIARLFDISGDNAPTDQTAGELGDVYMDILTGLSYELKEIEDDPVKYIWQAVTQLDEELDLMIGRAEQDFLRIRGVAFQKDESGDPVYPYSADIIAAEMVCYLLGIGRYLGRGKGSENLSGRGAQYDKKIFGYPMSIVGGITRYQRAI